MASNMVARIYSSELVPERVEDAQRLWAEKIIPEMKRQPGFKHVFVLTDPKTRRVTTISIWETPTHSEEWGKSAAIREFASQLRGTVKHLPAPDILDVTLAG